MHETLRGLDPDRLERSCTPRTNTIRLGAGAPGLERAEMRFASCRFSPHRHDTYAIGITTAGVQEFRYRGRRHICLPGQLHFLYPDETHDGGPRPTPASHTASSIPSQSSSAMRSGRPPPSSPSPSRTDACDPRAGQLLDGSTTGRDLGRHEAPPRSRRPPGCAGRRNGGEGRIDLRRSARALHAAHASEQTPASTLERIAGIDRYAIARQFRRAYGTSPDRY
jgi:hypothetical protein